MKASELVGQIENLVAKYGDMDVELKMTYPCGEGIEVGRMPCYEGLSLGSKDHLVRQYIWIGTRDVPPMS